MKFRPADALVISHRDMIFIIGLSAEFVYLFALCNLAAENPRMFDGVGREVRRLICGAIVVSLLSHCHSFVELTRRNPARVRIRPIS
jgi:hypothetical protein